MKKVIAISIVVISPLILMMLSDDCLAKGKRYGNPRSFKGAKTIDGDTFRYGEKRYRIQNINAPEIGKPGWKQSTRSLQRKIDSGNYKWQPVARDVYGRTVVKPKKIK